MLINLWHLWDSNECPASLLAYIQKQLENISWEIYFLGKQLTNIWAFWLHRASKLQIKYICVLDYTGLRLQISCLEAKRWLWG